MKLSFILFILPLVAAAAQDGNLHDSSPVEAANAAADRHHLRRVLTAESVGCKPTCTNNYCKTGETCAVVDKFSTNGNGQKIKVGTCAECYGIKDVDVLTAESVGSCAQCAQMHCKYGCDNRSTLTYDSESDTYTTQVCGICEDKPPSDVDGSILEEE